tara:strand:+ start:34947 stop:36230 length:1284 start_codon:yes stop_codon:yes gene_type:complete
MENLNIDKILNRDKIKQEIINFLKNFNNTRHDITQKRGIYVFGEPGTGKTHFIKEVIKEANYDIIYYNASDVRNKSVIDTITKNNMSDRNIIDMFHKKNKQIVIVMDEIDGMNNGDKGGINALIKLIRPKKTKKQKLEEITNNPIICIGNHHTDKKIKEMLKVCNSYMLDVPTTNQIENIIIQLFSENITKNKEHIDKICNYVQGDIRRLKQLYDIYFKSEALFIQVLYSCHPNKYMNEDTKDMLIKLFKNNFNIEQHLSIINETDRTIIGLLWHENIIDIFPKYEVSKIIPFYRKVLDNICFSDYVDRITFQKQIWQLNEMTSLIKTMKNNFILHKTLIMDKHKFKDIRFTKVLTKYSTEYNNSLFLQQICKSLDLDKKDMILYFLKLRDKNESESVILENLENYEISKLDFTRINKFIDKLYLEE